MTEESSRDRRGQISRRAALRSGIRAGTGLGAAALLGCASAARPTVVAGTPVAGTATPVSAPTVEPRRGGTLRIAGQITGDLPGYDYDRNGSSTLGSVANLAGVKLTQWDERPESTGPVEQVIPDLAESWESPDQGLTWTFRLRKNARTPEGLEATAEDVVWSLNRQPAVREPAGLVQGNLPELYTRTGSRAEVNAKALDRYTVQFRLARPDADFLSITGSHWWTVQHREVVTRRGASPWGEVAGIDQIRGAGPYYPVEHQPATTIRLRRNPNFYDPSAGYFDAIEHPIILDPAAAIAALKADRLDAFGPLAPLSVAQGLDLQKVEHLRVDWQPCMAWSPWIFDLRAKPFNDVRVRRAIALAVDRPAWIRNQLHGRGRNGTMVLPWLTSWALEPEKMGEDGRYVTSYDLAEAKKLLLAAGQEKLKFALQTANTAAYTVTFPYADLMTSMLANVGVQMQTRIVDYSTHIGGRTFPEGGVYQSFVARPDIQSYAYGQVGMTGTVGGADVYGGLAKAEPEYQALRDLAERQRGSLDRTARRELIHEMQRRWARNVWNFHWPAPDTPVVANRKVHHFRPPPGWNWNVLKYVWRDV